MANVYNPWNPLTSVFSPKSQKWVDNNVKNIDTNVNNSSTTDMVKSKEIDVNNITVPDTRKVLPMTIAPWKEDSYQKWLDNQVNIDTKNEINNQSLPEVKMAKTLHWLTVDEETKIFNYANSLNLANEDDFLEVVHDKYNAIRAGKNKRYSEEMQKKKDKEYEEYETDKYKAEEQSMFEWAWDLIKWVWQTAVNFYESHQQISKWFGNLSDKAALWVVNYARWIIWKEPVENTNNIQSTVQEDLLDMWEWTFNEVFTIVAPYFTIWLNTIAQTPRWQESLEYIWKWFQKWWEYINKIEWLKQIRDGYSDEDKKRFDWFIAWLAMLWIFKWAKPLTSWWKSLIKNTFQKTIWMLPDDVKTTMWQFVKSYKDIKLKDIWTKLDNILNDLIPSKSWEPTNQWLKMKNKAVEWIKSAYKNIENSKTFSEMKTWLDSSTKIIKKSLDKELMKDTSKYKIQDTIKAVWEKTYNYVELWLKSLEELSKVWIKEKLGLKIEWWKTKFENEWLNRFEINEIAKELAKQKKTFNEYWDKLKWNWATASESIRAWIKDFVRNWWNLEKIDSAKLTNLDKTWSNEIAAKTLIEKMVNEAAVDTQRARMIWWSFRNVARNVLSNVVDFASFWYSRAILFKIGKILKVWWSKKPSILELQNWLQDKLNQYKNLIKQQKNYNWKINNKIKLTPKENTKKIKTDNEIQDIENWIKEILESNILKERTKQNKIESKKTKLKESESVKNIDSWIEKTLSEWMLNPNRVVKDIKNIKSKTKNALTDFEKSLKKWFNTGLFKNK